ncbi:hypothetical protein K438DRAFT_1972013 [Mycena galopus ATCC 62051]|nr:hypothetical protein K438DRAFT_1972013 [Mycena galopus ATCC 62051]
MGTAEEVRNSFKGWDPRIETMLGFVDKLYVHEPLTSWSHPSHSLLLIGDAAHAMTPSLVQGAAVCIEDAAILDSILSHPRFSFPCELRAALPTSERLCLARPNKITATSIESQWFTQMADGAEQRARDAWLLEHLER